MWLFICIEFWIQYSSNVMLCAKFSWNWHSGFGEQNENLQIYYTNDNDAANHRQQTHIYQKSSLEPSANRRTKKISLSNYKWSWSPTGEKGRYFEKDISTENKPIYWGNELRSLSTFYTIGIKLKLEWAKDRENMLQTKL